VEVSNDENIIRESTHIILPGVGSFGAAMEKISKKIPVDELKRQVIDRKKPFLGICVGMQVLADKGYEFGEHQGFGWIPGVVDKLDGAGLPVPHIGWNDMRIQRSSQLLASFGAGQDFYFVHSFIFKPQNTDHILANTEYGQEFCSVVNRENIYGVQFHPEKSQKAGKRIINNFLMMS
jgi:glutamine amidotransferase